MKNTRGKTGRLGNTLLILVLIVSLSPPLVLSAQSSGTGVFINEIHYDNDGTDADEAIEIAGPAGTDLTGWTLVLYNGNGGALYNTTSLSGTIPDQQNGHGTAYWPISGIQNGSPDGVALVDAGDVVIQFLSYEGTFEAVDGPAAGMTSVDIGVSEESTTPVGFSLQLAGTGTTYEDFTWSTPAASTFGAVNMGQTFPGGGPDYTPIYDIQYTTDPGGASPYDGQEVTTEGIVTAVFGNGYFIEDPAGGSWSGLWVYDGNTPALGDRVRLTGTIAEYYELTELADLTAYSVASSGNALPGPAVVTTGAANDEQYEGVLVRVENVAVTAEEDSYNEWQVDDGSGPLMVDNLGTDTYVPVLGDTLAAVTGPLNYNYGAFKIAPRDDNDILLPGAAADLVINEIDYDQPSTDTAEFVEIHNNGDTMVDLAGWVIELVNGTGGGAAVYGSFDLSGYSLAAGGYFVLCGDAANVPNCDLDVTPDSNLVQNGAPDAVGLRFNGDLIDAVSYEGDTGAPYTEGSGAGLEDSGDGSISRCPDGVDTNTNNVDLIFTATSTPGAENNCAPPPPEGCGDPFTAVYTIQGSGATSPLVGTEISVEGVVVGDFQNNGEPDNGELNGFHIQDPAGDGDAATSDGIFVYAPSGMDVSLGDGVRVRGTVSEYAGLTEISASQLWVCSSGNSVSPTELSLPVATSDAWEPYEGMLVTFPQALYISEYFDFDRYGEIVLTNERQFQPTAVYEPGSPEAADLALANQLGRITLDDGRTSQNPDPALHPNGLVFDLSNLFRGGDTVQNVTGVVDQYSAYRIQPTQGADYDLPGNPANPRTAAPDDVGGSLKVASFNVLNYFTSIDEGEPICGPAGDQECRGADTEEEFTRQKAKIIAALVALDADVVGLIEIENHPGDVPTADLVSGLNGVLGAGTYGFVATGSIGTDAIRQAFIYKAATVSPMGAHAVLDNPSFTDPVGYGQQQSRPALAQTFRENTTGGVFTVVVNHLKSKGSACGTGDDDPEQGNCNLTRTLGAKALVDWLATDPTGSGDSDVLIIGDLNSYDKEEPVDALLAGGYSDLVRAYGGEYAYSYVFDGQLGYLDHALANGGLLDEVTGTTVWHINADEPDLIDYDMSYKQDAQDALYAPDAYRSSDHDPVIIGLAVSEEIVPTVTLTGPSAAMEGDTAHYSYTVSGDPDFDTFILDSASCGDGGLLSNSAFDGATGNGSFDCAFPNGPVTTAVSVTVSDDDGDSGNASLTVTVANVAPSVEAGADQQAFEDTEVHLDPASFSDPGTGDSHGAIIDWGDGTIEPGSVDQENDLVAGSHVYAEPGIYIVTVTVVDSDGDGSNDSLAITVVHGFMQYALYANQDVLQIEEIANISGDVGGEALIELKTGSMVRGDVIGGDDILLDRRAYVWGDAIAAGEVTLRPGARVRGEIVNQASLPPVSPVSVSISACESDVHVGKWRFASLQPGCYKLLTVDEHAILRLAAGHYTFEKVEVDKGAIVWFDLRDGGQAVIDVADSVDLQDRVWMIPHAGDASGILFRVAGGDVNLGRFGKFVGTFIAPDALFDQGLGARLTGAVYAKKVQMEKWAHVTADPALALFIELFVQ